MSMPYHHAYSLKHLGGFPVLASNRLLGFIGTSLIGIFLPIFLFEFFGQSVQWVLVWLLINLLLKVPFFIFAAKSFARIGLSRAMMIGTLGLAGAYAALSLLDRGVALHPYVLMGLTMAGFCLSSVFYWAPYHVDFAKFSSKNHRGVQLSIFYSVQRLVSVAAPLLAAVLIASFGYYASFSAGLIFAFASLVPLLFLPAYHVTYEFGYVETFKKLASKNYRGMTLSMMALGAEDAVSSAVWPLFLFLVFQGSYLDVGMVSAAIVVMALALEYLVGKETDKLSPSRMLKWGSWLYALGWVFKGLVSSTAGVFAASTFHNFGSIVMRTPLDTLTYQQAADSGHYIDEYTVLREMALTMGRAGMFVVLIPLTFFLPLSFAFLLTALVSLGTNLAAQYHAGKQI